MLSSLDFFFRASPFGLLRYTFVTERFLSLMRKCLFFFSNRCGNVSEGKAQIGQYLGETTFIVQLWTTRLKTVRLTIICNRPKRMNRCRIWMNRIYKLLDMNEPTSCLNERMTRSRGHRKCTYTNKIQIFSWVNYKQYEKI